uniref:C2H2-type domain-containing protein n=1 Tax=Macrostomum lignano TaxID=282301 RepID=A0A1I8F8Y8_9PLAT
MSPALISTAVATPTAGSASGATPSHRKRPGSSGPSGPASSRTPSSSFSSSVHAPVPDCLHWRLTMHVCEPAGSRFAQPNTWPSTWTGSTAALQQHRTDGEAATTIGAGSVTSAASWNLQTLRAAREQSNFDVYAFEDEPDDVDIDASFVAKPGTPASATAATAEASRYHGDRLRSAAWLSETRALDNEIDDQSIDPKPAVRHQQRGSPPLAAAAQQQARKQQSASSSSSHSHRHTALRVISLGWRSITSTVVPCPICMTDMATLKSRDRHLLQRHPGGPVSGVGTNSAALAAAAAASLAGGDSSNNAESLVQPFLCTVCGSSFDRAQLPALDRKLRRAEAHCELCSAQFEKITAAASVTSPSITSTRRRTMHQCPAYFPSFSALRHHQRTVIELFMQWKEPLADGAVQDAIKVACLRVWRANTVLNFGCAAQAD